MRSLVKTPAAIFLAAAMFGLSAYAAGVPNSASPDAKDNSMKIVVKSAEHEVVYKLNESDAAKSLYAQLPLTVKVKPFSTNEIIFYPTKGLDLNNTPHSKGQTGSLSYYERWGNVVMFYAPCNPNSSLYELGSVVSGEENISKLTGTVMVLRLK